MTQPGEGRPWTENYNNDLIISRFIMGILKRNQAPEVDNGDEDVVERVLRLDNNT